MVPLNRYIVFFSLAILGTALDLGSKEWVFAEMGMPREKESIWIWEGVLGITTTLNEGTLFSLGQGATPVFALLSIVTAIGLPIWLFYYGAAKNWMLTISLGAVMGGALGNLYDRLGIHGLIWNYSNELHKVGEPVYAVRDWIDFRLINWPIFNIADSFIVVGTILLAWHVLFSPTEEKETETTESSSSEASSSKASSSKAKTTT